MLGEIAEKIRAKTSKKAAKENLLKMESELQDLIDTQKHIQSGKAEDGSYWLHEYWLPVTQQSLILSAWKVFELINSYKN